MSTVEKLSREEIRRRIGLVSGTSTHTEAPPIAPGNGGVNGASEPIPTWEEPKKLPDKLSAVDDLKIEFLPEVIAPWVLDISERLQCPPDYVAVAAMTALGSVIGRRIGIKPQQKTDWLEVPNLWGAIIGRPGMMKSPAMMEALKPLHHLEAEAAKKNEAARKAYEAAVGDFTLRKQVKASLDKEELKKQKQAEIELYKERLKQQARKDDLGEEPQELEPEERRPQEPKPTIDLGEEPQEPKPIRYRTNDSSYEAIHELLVANPTGALIERDELVSLLMHLDQEEEIVARGFYLSGWAGTQPYTVDRIGRGHLHVDAVCVSLLGTTQPALIGEYVRRANAGGQGGDGLIQRFGLMVWPDEPADWKNVDEYPDTRAREAAWETFERLAKIDLAAALKLGAEKGPYDKMPFMRFDEAAAAEILGWRQDLEGRLRGGDLSPALEGHIAKYRKLVPALALINHLVDGGTGPVGLEALLRALAFSKYLEGHARRVYGAGGMTEVNAADAILRHIRRGELKNGFTARDVHQRDWSRLTDRHHVQLGLDLLVELHHLAVLPVKPGPLGGRPSATYAINPASGGDVL